MNIQDKGTLRECTSCQMCAVVCPKKAISINLDRDGFYRPEVNPEKCVDCGICKSVCYKYDTQIENYGNEKLATTKLYGAFANNNDVVDNTTSGGIADLLARKLIKNGYKCIGVVYDSEKDTAVHRIAYSEYEVKAFRGSKYLQSYTVNAFEQLVKESKKEKYAVFGTPCQIYAIDKYLRSRNIRNNHILIDLYCHGCPSMNIWKKYIKNIKQIIRCKKIDYVNFRSKAKGWGNFYIIEMKVNGNPVYFSNSKKDEFFQLFFCDQLLNEACNKCQIRSTLAYTDIRLGDFWGKQYVLNNKGVSAVSLVTDRAKAIFEEIRLALTYREEQYENLLPWQSWGKEYHPDNNLRKVLMEQLCDDSIPLSESIDTIYRYQGKKSTLIRIAKNLVHMMPICIEKRIRWVFYQLKK